MPLPRSRFYFCFQQVLLSLMAFGHAVSNLGRQRNASTWIPIHLTAAGAFSLEQIEEVGRKETLDILRIGGNHASYGFHRWCASCSSQKLTSCLQKFHLVEKWILGNIDQQLSAQIDMRMQIAAEQSVCAAGTGLSKDDCYGSKRCLLCCDIIHSICIC